MRRISTELRWKQLRRGIAQLVALAAVAVAIFFMDDARRALEYGPALELIATEARQLEVGADVWVAGKIAGEVVAIHFIEGVERGEPHLSIRAVLTREAASVLRGDVRARIQRSGLLAPVVINLEPEGPGGEPFNFSDTLLADPPITSQALLALGDSLTLLLQELQPLAERLESDFTAGGGTFAAFGERGEVFAGLQTEIVALDRTLSRHGTLARLGSDTTIRASLDRSMRRLEQVASSARARGDAAADLTSALESLAAGAGALGTDLRAGRGTAGRALYDKELETQARLFRARMDSVTAELLLNPLRWLRFRLF